MRVLHLFSNWKLTGPAEPAVNIAAECARLGIQTRFFCGKTPNNLEKGLEHAARERGLEPETGLTLSKHWNPLWNFLDARALRPVLTDWKPDIVHCHANNDTRIALAAARRLPQRPLVVRTSYSGSPADLPPPELYLLRRVDAVITVSREVAQTLASDHSVKSDSVSHIATGVDISRFDPDSDTVPLPEEWTAPIIGVVARIQPRRRFDILFGAFKKLLDSLPEATLVVVGRGTRKKQVGEVPVQKMGIAHRVVFPGYLERDEYVAALGGFDALVYLVPGTDGSCRTVREAMVMGVPVVSSRRGILPELVQDGETGWTADEDPDALCEALLKALQPPERLQEMKKATKRRGRDRFSLGRQGTSTKSLYERLTGSK
jgi:glycosyltransferase involved in cell wall biosynthesis